MALQLPLPEFVIILTGIGITGFAAGFLWLNRQGGEEALKLQIKKSHEAADQWRLKYYDLSESNEKAVQALKESISIYEEKEEQLSIEIEELTLLNQQLMLKQKNAASQSAQGGQETATLQAQLTQLNDSLESLALENQKLKEELAGTREKLQWMTDMSQHFSMLESKLVRLSGLEEVGDEQQKK